jgi:hypothetical protein
MDGFELERRALSTGKPEALIFKDHPNKYGVSTLMHTDFRNRLIHAVLHAEQRMEEFVADGVRPNKKRRFCAFGGAAYVFHAMDLNSPFAHVLPKIHDMDFTIELISEDDIRGDTRGDTRRDTRRDTSGDTSGDTSRDTSGDTSRDTSGAKRVQNLSSESAEEYASQKNMCTNVLAQFLRTITRALVESLDAPLSVSTAIALNGSNVTIVNPVNVDTAIMNDFLQEYVETVFTEHFMISTIANSSEFRVHVNIAYSVDNRTYMDHVVEFIYLVNDLPTPPSFSRLLTLHDLGVQVWSQTLKILYTNTLDAVYDRACAVKIARHHENIENTGLFIGKCSQDILRIAFVILHELHSQQKSFLTTTRPEFVAGEKIPTIDDDGLCSKMLKMTNVTFLEFTFEVLNGIRECTSFAAMACRSSRDAFENDRCDVRLLELLNAIMDGNYRSYASEHMRHTKHMRPLIEDKLMSWLEEKLRRQGNFDIEARVQRMDVFENVEYVHVHVRKVGKNFFINNVSADVTITSSRNTLMFRTKEDIDTTDIDIGDYDQDSVRDVVYFVPVSVIL